MDECLQSVPRGVSPSMQNVAEPSLVPRSSEDPLNRSGAQRVNGPSQTGSRLRRGRVGWMAAVLAMGGAATLTGCAFQAPWRKPYNPPPRVPPEVIVQRAADLWRPRLGVVMIVDKEGGFALIDIGTAPAPAAGTALKSFTLDKETTTKSLEAPPPTAELTVSAFQRRPFLIADLKSGTPKVGDSVVSVDRPGQIVSGVTIPPATRAGDRAKDQSKGGSGTPANSPQSSPGPVATPPNRGAGEVPPGAVPEPNPAGASGPIIPGLAPKPAGAVPLQ
jgi:hypothetical protein